MDELTVQNTYVCERCGTAVMRSEWEWLDGERICLWCKPDLICEPEATDPEVDGPPHVYSRFWEGER